MPSIIYIYIDIYETILSFECLAQNLMTIIENDSFDIVVMPMSCYHYLKAFWSDVWLISAKFNSGKVNPMLSDRPTDQSNQANKQTIHLANACY